MSKIAGAQVNIKSLPKVVRVKIKQIHKLWREGNLKKLRKIRDNCSNLNLVIYHHSFGTDSYYHDIEGRYFTWDQIQEISNKKMNTGHTTVTVVMPYKPGVCFTKSSILSNPVLN